MADRLSNVVRRKFIEYFTLKHGHTFIKSSSVVPEQDKTLSFVNAGMNQFKPLFLADLDHYSPNRVCNYQKCIRVGGKTCDLNTIGRDFRHHTFFEMLGNWSFNDYGKQHACEWALDYLVNHLNLDPAKLVTTYHSAPNDEDLETKEIWQKLGLAPHQIIANSQGDNFWEMGDSGPCGMSTEIFYPVDGQELLEIWNIVFIDRQRLTDGTIVPLRNKFVDTGMGLERILSVLEKTNSNYDTDLFKSMFQVIQAKSNVEPYKGTLDDPLDIKYRILADHCRMITIALADGIKPGRIEAAFNLRSIIKKVLLISRDDFNQETPRYLLFDLVDETVNILGEAYPDLQNSVKNTRKVLAKESQRYLNYLGTSSKIVKLRNIKRALLSQPDETVSYILSGRVSNYRPYKSFNFIDLVDGSSKDHLQVVIKRDLLHKPELGSYMTCLGKIVESRGAGQAVEFKAEKLDYLGGCDPETYPLASVANTISPSKQISPPGTAQQTVSPVHNDWFRRYTHLRPRAPHFASLLRVRSELELSIHMIMKQMDFFRVHTPSLTSNDSEASSDLFAVKRSKISANDNKSENGMEPTTDGKEGRGLFDCEAEISMDVVGEAEAEADSDRSEDEETGDKENAKQRVIRDGYFNKDVFLVTSAQLHLENLASALSRVYTLSTTFRAESSISTRHLCEFLMFELEEANLSELKSLMDRAESIVKFIAQFLCEISEHKSDFSSLLEMNLNRDTYQKLAEEEYIRMTYAEAMQILQNKGFQGDTKYGADIGRLHEKELLKHCGNVPIFITNYPRQLKPFYMKRSGAPSMCDQVECFDLIAPHGGEICGGSLREDSLDQLVANLRMHTNQAADLTSFNWYLDTRRFGSFPHGGFGLGFERLLQSLLGIKNIRDTTAFPRWTRHCPM